LNGNRCRALAIQAFEGRTVADRRQSKLLKVNALPLASKRCWLL
jgi:hypothetical protein